MGSPQRGVVWGILFLLLVIFLIIGGVTFVKQAHAERSGLDELPQISVGYELNERSVPMWHDEVDKPQQVNNIVIEGALTRLEGIQKVSENLLENDEIRSLQEESYNPDQSLYEVLYLHLDEIHQTIYDLEAENESLKKELAELK